MVWLRVLPENALRVTGQPRVSAYESKVSVPLVHVTCGHGPEEQPLPVATGDAILQLLRLFILAILRNVYFIPQSTTWVGIGR